ncbi:hypothetical protein [Actinacidiphila oryziradicis]|jgi:hypothetical protein|uniref:hypothetical protein n=1 Tax=Actinacidiphila oryziradicis TaxID=2571141 RepID=UPI0023F16CF1|nr:hypothetical protein [Actinacidiphila oryziradicis]MCW2870891.1 hypothetical protein [Actinacidiphila oryziradicis]
MDRTPGGIRYQEDIGGTNKLMTSPEMLAIMVAAAEAGKEFAKGIAPVKSGDYVSKFRVEGELKGGPRHNRAEARLVNDSEHAAEVEWRNHGGERILGKAADYIEGHVAH